MIRETEMKQSNFMRTWRAINADFMYIFVRSPYNTICILVSQRTRAASNNLLTINIQYDESGSISIEKNDGTPRHFEEHGLK